jgi:DNA repair protein RadC
MTLRIQTYELALKKIGKRPGQSVAFAENAAAIFHELLDDSPMEKIYTLLLDGQNHLRGAVMVAMGGLHGAAVTPRDILTPALVGGASAIILGHNHPSGDPRPSAEDIEMTRAVDKACNVVGLSLLDHIIVASGGHTSLADYGIFTDSRIAA